MTFVGVLTRALRGEGLDELATLTSTLDLVELARSATDVVLCWWVNDRSVPDAVRARTTAALAGGAAAQRAALAAMLGEPFEPPTAPEGDWEALATWAVGASALALPGIDRGTLAGREEDLLRGLGLAMLLRNGSIAARLVRWLSLALPAAAFRDALDDVQRISRAGDALVAADVAVAIARRAAVTEERTIVARALPDPEPLAADQRSVFLERALGWVEAHLDRFAIRGSEPDARIIPKYKAAGELALVAGHVIAAGEREGRESWRSRGAALQDFARRQVDGDKLAELVERIPYLAVFSTILPGLHRAGLRSDRLFTAITRHAPAVAPDLAYMVGVSMCDIGLSSPWDLETAWAWTRIVKEPAPWQLSTAELYLLLHEVWYRCAHGWTDDRGRTYIARWLPVWMRYTQMGGHHDLLAELVITWHALHGRPAPAGAWKVLVAAQRADGAIPTTRPNVNAGTHVMTDEYHATLNAIWAAATQPTS